MISPIYTVNTLVGHTFLYSSFFGLSRSTFGFIPHVQVSLVLLILFIPIPLPIATHILLFFYQLCNELAQNIYGSVNTGEIPFDVEE